MCRDHPLQLWLQLVREEGSYRRPKPSWPKRLCSPESESEVRLPLPEQTAAWLDRRREAPCPSSPIPARDKLPVPALLREKLKTRQCGGVKDGGEAAECSGLLDATPPMGDSHL